jgi:bis(5'-adenosyl)-triphosphatase
MDKLTNNTFPFLPDVLVCSTRPVPRLTDLRADELAEVMHAVQRVGRVVERAYKADGFTIACQVMIILIYTHPPIPHFFDTLHPPLMSDRVYSVQDGPAAGQTVPHVHFHLLPRRLQGDRFSGSQPDAVYVELEKREGVLPQDLAAASSGSHMNTDARSPEPLRVDADADREPRTLEDMEQEAKWLAGFFEEDK